MRGKGIFLRMVIVRLFLHFKASFRLAVEGGGVEKMCRLGMFLLPTNSLKLQWTVGEDVYMPGLQHFVLFTRHVVIDGQQAH